MARTHEHKIDLDIAHSTFRLGQLAGVALGCAAVVLALGSYWVLIPCALCYTAATFTAAAKIYRPEGTTK